MAKQLDHVCFHRKRLPSWLQPHLKGFHHRNMTSQLQRSSRVAKVSSNVTALKPQILPCFASWILANQSAGTSVRGESEPAPGWHIGPCFSSRWIKWKRESMAPGSSHDIKSRIWNAFGNLGTPQKRSRTLGNLDISGHDYRKKIICNNLIQKTQLLILWHPGNVGFFHGATPTPCGCCGYLWIRAWSQSRVIAGAIHRMGPWSPKGTSVQQGHPWMKQ